MLADMTPEQFREWEVEHYIQPWGDEWDQAGTIAAAAHNAGIWSKAAAGVEPEADDFLTPEHFIPGRTPQSRKPKRLTGREMEFEMRARYGAPPV